jgi:hypothetical protein
MKKYFMAAAVVLGFCLIAAAGPGPSKKFSVKPKISDPDGTDIVVAAWMTKSGLPDSGKSNHALYFQKDGATSDNASASGEIRWLQKRDVSGLTELGFDFRNGDHCTANAPRFVIQVDGVDYSLGCTAGVATPAPDDTVNWTRVRFGATEFGAAGLPATGMITGASIVFDEGTDAGSGLIFMDNIDVNAALIGKPGKGKTPPPAF